MINNETTTDANKQPIDNESENNTIHENFKHSIHLNSCFGKIGSDGPVSTSQS